MSYHEKTDISIFHIQIYSKVHIRDVVNAEFLKQVQQHLRDDWFIDLMEANGYIYHIPVNVQAQLACLLLDVMNGSMFDGNTLALFYEIFHHMPISKDTATTILQKWRCVEKIEPIMDSDNSAFDDWVIEHMMGAINQLSGMKT
ncbi:hypothetical protein BDQ17DRAFT_1323606 [Cyathus striatus]|nr:hypothetical protein BDQ17DRAFT_1323606 [Cyathus striatus]